MAFMVVLSILAMSALFALTADAGMWLFDHRTAQNQAEAAVLAAGQYLPASNTAVTSPTFPGNVAANAALTANGYTSGAATAGACPVASGARLEYLPAAATIKDSVKVCVRRSSGFLFFAAMSNVTAVNVSGSATARVGPAASPNVMPWAIIAPDPACKTAGEQCQADVDGNGTIGATEHCGYYPPVPVGQVLCPWGLSGNRLYGLVHNFPGATSASPTPGPALSTTAALGKLLPIQAGGGCGTSTSDYEKCVSGNKISQAFTVGQPVSVLTAFSNNATDNNSVGRRTRDGLNTRYPSSPIDLVTLCNVGATPMTTPATSFGLDPAPGEAAATSGKLQAIKEFGNSPEHAGCEFRLVSILILQRTGSSTLTVLAVATFAIARWDRVNSGGTNYSDARANTLAGAGTPCNDPPSGTAGLTPFTCGTVWGYLMEYSRVPNPLFGRICRVTTPASLCDITNPYSPRMIAVEE